MGLSGGFGLSYLLLARKLSSVVPRADVGLLPAELSGSPLSLFTFPHTYIPQDKYRNNSVSSRYGLNDIFNADEVNKFTESLPLNMMWLLGEFTNSVAEI